MAGLAAVDSRRTLRGRKGEFFGFQSIFSMALGDARCGRLASGRRRDREGLRRGLAAPTAAATNMAFAVIPDRMPFRWEPRSLEIRRGTGEDRGNFRPPPSVGSKNASSRPDRRASLGKGNAEMGAWSICQNFARGISQYADLVSLRRFRNK